MIDPISLKLLNYLVKKRKALHANRKYNVTTSEYLKPEEYYLVSINEIKRLLPFYSASCVLSNLNYLLENKYIELTFGESCELSLLLNHPDKKIFEITSKGWSSVRSYYLRVSSIIALSMISLCLIVLMIELYFRL